MERLTGYDEYGNADIIGVDSMDLQCNFEFDEFNKVTKALNKLAKYEDLEGQGKLLKLPCAVGDTVYAFNMAKVVEFKVVKISWFTMDRKHIINVECLNTDCFRNFIKEEFGKTVFPTREEAEAALKKL